LNLGDAGGINSLLAVQTVGLGYCFVGAMRMA